MVVEEILSALLVRHYSDAGMKIRQVETGTSYDEAVDVIPCRYTYEETDIPLEPEELTDSDALRIITGGVTDGT